MTEAELATSEAGLRGLGQSGKLAGAWYAVDLTTNNLEPLPLTNHWAQCKPEKEVSR